VPAAPDADDPDVPEAPDADDPLDEPEPLPIVASVRMYDALPEADDPDAPDAAPPEALPLPEAPLRCRHPVNVTVPLWLLCAGLVSVVPPERPGWGVVWPGPCAASTAAEPNAIAANVPTRFIIGLLGR
jgi:hypothetical protein